MIALLVRYWYLAAIASLLALLGVQTVRISALKTEQAEYVLESEKAARLAVEQAIAEQSRRQQAYDEETQHARAEKAELEATVVQLANDADSLRDSVAKYQRSRSTACIASRGQNQPRDPARDLLADLYIGLVKAAQDTSGFAERLYIAGDSCERSADRLTSGR